MANEAGIYNTYQNNFHLNEANLRKIHTIFTQYAEKLDCKTLIEFNISREDNSFYSTADIEDVLLDENIKKKSILNLSISIKEEKEGDDLQRHSIDHLAKITFQKEEKTRVQYHIYSKSRDWCFLLADELDTQIKRCLTTKTYSFLFERGIDPFLFMIFSFIILAGVLMMIPESPPTLTPDQITAMSMQDQITFLVEKSVEKRSSIFPSFFITVAIWMSLFIFFMIYTPISKILLSTRSSVFYWGDMITIYDKYQANIHKLKWGIIIAFLVSLIASLVGSFINNAG